MQTKYNSKKNIYIYFKGKGWHQRQLAIFPWCQCKYRKKRARHILCFPCQCHSPLFRFIVLVTTMEHLRAHQITPVWRGLFLGPGTPVFLRNVILKRHPANGTYFFHQRKFLTCSNTWWLMIISYAWRSTLLIRFLPLQYCKETICKTI